MQVPSSPAFRYFLTDFALQGRALIESIRKSHGEAIDPTSSDGLLLSLLTSSLTLRHVSSDCATVEGASSASRSKALGRIVAISHVSLACFGLNNNLIACRYSDKTHFFLELLQNCDDNAYSTCDTRLSLVCVRIDCVHRCQCGAICLDRTDERQLSHCALQ